MHPLRTRYAAENPALQMIPAMVARTAWASGRASRSGRDNILWEADGVPDLYVLASGGSIRLTISGLKPVMLDSAAEVQKYLLSYQAAMHKTLQEATAYLKDVGNYLVKNLSRDLQVRVVPERAWFPDNDTVPTVGLEVVDRTSQEEIRIIWDLAAQPPAAQVIYGTDVLMTLDPRPQQAGPALMAFLTGDQGPEFMQRYAPASFAPARV